MIVLTNAQMKEAERRAIEDFGISSLILMENAALNVVGFIEKRFSKKAKILVLCGRGNNGGDGFAIARGLFSRGFDVSVCPCGDMEKATPDCKANLEAAQNIGVPFNENYKAEIARADIIIDALIGTGLTKALRPDTAEIAAAVNEGAAYVIAVDCPTGINTDTGEALGETVRADVTFTFHAPKAGLLLYPAREYTGELFVGSIGTPLLSAQEPPYINMLTDREAAELLPKRSPTSNKGSYGRVVAFSGCDEMTGAAVLNLTAAYKSGAGLVCGVCTEKCAEVIHGALTEAVTKIAPDKKGFLTPKAYERAKPFITEKTAVAAGSGLGVSPTARELIRVLIQNIKTTLIIDADGINCLCDMKDILKTSQAEIILTPHIKEMSRLSGIPLSEIKADPINTALNFAREYNVTLVLKDAVTVIASPDGRITINTAGTSAMSKGGTGDVLTGLAAGLAAQGLKGHNAAALAAYINGKAGEKGEKEVGQYGLLASDLCRYIPQAMEELKTSLI